MLRFVDLSHRLGPLLLAAAYYLGAQVGFALQSPNAPQSVLWLPNSILLGTLLIVPYRKWPVYLAAAFPAQMLMAWQTGAPASTLALLFVTNCTDAALGAFLVRRIARSTGAFQFDGLRSTSVFVVFATLATFVLSFGDAAISLATHWAGSFNAAFLTRVRSNTLTHLIVVPAIVDTAAITWHRVNVRRVGEAVLLAVLLVLTCAIGFGRPAGSQMFPALFYLPLPLLLWAAVGFGPGGIGWGALVVSLIVSWTALHGAGPFGARSPQESVVSLQLFLLASTIPLLFLAGGIRERNTAARSVRDSESALRESYAQVRELAGKLIAAQEVERARIARDLHDDFNQQLAALSISISALRQRRPVNDAELDHALRVLQERTIALTEQIRLFSRDLHPGVLDHVGLVPALRSHCIRFAEQHRLDFSFDAHEDLGTIDREAAICIYRIVQEGLRNIVNHAHSPSAAVTLTRVGHELQLTIDDRGRGFEPANAATRGGLGLLSIEERARLVNGRVSITSTHGRGTKIDVYIPVTPAWRGAAPAVHA
jgi:two-component system sensor histidine kinase UhpB